MCLKKQKNILFKRDWYNGWGESFCTKYFFIFRLIKRVDRNFWTLGSKYMLGIFVRLIGEKLWTKLWKERANISPRNDIPIIEDDTSLNNESLVRNAGTFLQLLDFQIFNKSSIISERLLWDSRFLAHVIEDFFALYIV